MNKRENHYPRNLDNNNNVKIRRERERERERERKRSTDHDCVGSLTITLDRTLHCSKQVRVI